MYKATIAKTLLTLFRKEVDQPIAEWSEQNISLKNTIEGRNGQKFPNWDAFPSMKEIFEFVKNPEVKEIYLNFSAQFCKTFSEIILTTFFIFQGRTVLFLLPDGDKLNKVRDRVKKVILANRDFLGYNDEKGAAPVGAFAFRNGAMLYFGLSSVPSNMDETPADVVIFDEYDVHMNSPKSNKIDARSRVLNRLTSKSNGLFIASSTASTIKGNGGITDLYNGSRRYDNQLPCNKCGAYHTYLYDDDFRVDEYPKDDLPVIERDSLGFVVCPHCQAELRDSDQYEMLKGAKFVVKEEDANKTLYAVGFHATTWSGPNKNFSEIVHQRLRAGDDPLLMADFYNSRESKPRDFSRMNGNTRDGLNRLDYDLRCPPSDVKVMTCGIDVGKTRAHIVLLGWGYNGNTYLIYKNEINFGDRSQLKKSLTDHITELFVNRVLINNIGERVRFIAGAIDQGYCRQEVFDFCTKNPMFKPFKGDANLSQRFMIRDADPKNEFRQKYRGIKATILNHDTWQDTLASMIEADPLEGNAFFIPNNCPNDYEDHICSMVQRETFIGKKKILKWEPQSKATRVDFRDATIYALAVGITHNIQRVIRNPTAEKQREEKHQSTFNNQRKRVKSDIIA
ncbi:MAG: hypothetical protein GY941_28965, partial [Planctomycetes bacterium]|nr:hypothetical protein [Planctomycetota bacterium]